jgi:hypothetical protein
MNNRRQTAHMDAVRSSGIALSRPQAQGMWCIAHAGKHEGTLPKRQRSQNFVVSRKGSRLNEAHAESHAGWVECPRRRG